MREIAYNCYKCGVKLRSKPSSEGQQGAEIELHARLSEGRRGDAIGQRLVVEYLEEAVEFVADTALAQVQQHGHPMRQRQRALAGESFGYVLT